MILVDSALKTVYLYDMRSTTDNSQPATPEALNRHYRRILALSVYQQQLIDPKILEDARIWVSEAETSFIV